MSKDTRLNHKAGSTPATEGNFRLVAHKRPPGGQQDDSSESGFTLFEMMAVIAIIGVLAAIAIPRYQNHVARSQIASAYMVLKGQQINVEDVMLRGETPTLQALGFNGDTVTEPHGEWQVGNSGELRYTFGTGASRIISKGSWLRLTPLQEGGEGWRCDVSAGLDSGLLPAGCVKGVSD